jgi:hypothetical protein
VLKKRYDFYGAGGPIFAMRLILPPDPKLWVPIIPNIGPLLSFAADH